MLDDFLSEEIRAEDILLGSLGYAEDVTIVSIEPTNGGYRGKARFGDEQVFDFESEDEPSELERWALNVLVHRAKR